MARDAVWSLLNQDAQLNAMGLNAATILPNFTGDQRPTANGPFMSIRWGTTDYDGQVQRNTDKRFDLWVHFPNEITTDYVRVDRVIDRIDEIFEAANDVEVVGGDGMVLTSIEPEGRSGDLEDSVYQTICRSASYKAHSYKLT